MNGCNIPALVCLLAIGCAAPPEDGAVAPLGPYEHVPIPHSEPAPEGPSAAGPAAHVWPAPTGAPRVLGFSDDGSTLLWGRSAEGHGVPPGALYQTDVDSGRILRIDEGVVLTDDATIVRAMSADGRTVAYVKDVGHWPLVDLYVWQRGAGSRLVAPGMVRHSLYMLPDAATLVYAEGAGGDLIAYDVATDTHRIIHPAVLPLSVHQWDAPPLLTTTTGMVFATADTKQLGDLWAWERASHTVRLLDEDIFLGTVRLHADLQRLAWARNSLNSRQLVIEHLPTGDRLTSWPAASKTQYTTPTFQLSPDWSMAAYVQDGKGEKGALVLEELGTQILTTIDDGVRYGGLRFVSGEKRVIYVKNHKSYHDGDLWVYDRETGEKSKIAKGAHVGAGHLSRVHASPDGDRLVFPAGGCGPGDENALITYDFNTGSGAYIDNWMFCVWGAHFGPDGEQIFYYRTQQGTSPFMLHRYDTQTKLVDEVGPAFHYFTADQRHSVSNPGFNFTGQPIPLVTYDWLTQQQVTLYSGRGLASVGALNDTHVAWILDEDDRADVVISPLSP